MGGTAVARLAIALGFGQAGFYAFIASLPLAMVAAGRDNAEIGAIMGSAAIFNIAAALLSGGFIDRHGGRLVFIAGASCYLSADALLATGIVTPGGPLAALLVVRLLQGIGIATGMPAIMTLVPTLVDARRLPTALAFVGMASNLSLAVVPPLSLLVLDRGGIVAVALLSVIVGIAAILIVWPTSRGSASVAAAASGGAVPSRPHAFRPKWRPEWGAPLLVSVLFLAHWGVVTGYLPQRAERAGADVGLFFSGDALALLALRVAGGYLAGRFGSRWLLLSGLAVTAVAMSLLLLPPTTPLLILAGIGSGTGAALIIPTIMLELSQRSDESDRGSAFALFSVAFGMGVAIGSIGVAPIIDRVGFELALGAGIVAFAAAAVVTLLDRSFHGPMAGRPGPESMGEPAL